jgi:hypothetical protein
MVSTVLAAAACAGCGGYDGTPLCDRTELIDVLGSAEAGDTVNLGACTIEGGIVVPAGVTLAGVTPEQTTIAGATGDAVLLRTGDGTTTLRGLTIALAAGTGVRTAGAGRARIEDVQVRVDPIGVAIVAIGVAELTLEAVVATGPVTHDDARTHPIDASPRTAPSHGIGLTDVGTATFTDVRVEGFSRTAVQLIRTSLTWTGGEIARTAGTGLMVRGGRVDLRSITIREVWQGMDILPAIGGFFLEGAEVRSQSLVVEDNERLGLVHSGTGPVEHVDLAANRNGDVGAWSQLSEHPFVIRGPMTSFVRNHVAGINVVDTVTVAVEDARIDETILAPHFYSDLMGGDSAAGILSVNSHHDASYVGLSLSENEEIGIKIAMDDDTRGLELRDVTVFATGERLGVVAFGGTRVPGWDDGVRRLGTTETNDAMFPHATAVTPFGAMNPCELPPPDDAL